MIRLVSTNKRKCRKGFFSALLCFVLATSDQLFSEENSEIVSLTLKESVFVTESRLPLSQILDCVGSERRCAEILGLQYQREILPNQVVDLDRTEILQFIRAAISDTELQFSGEIKRVKVKSSGHRVSTAFVKEAIRQSVLEKAGSNASLRFVDLSLSGFTPKYFFTDDLDFEIDNQVLSKPVLDAEDILALKEIKSTTLNIRVMAGDRAIVDSQKVYLKLSFETERAVVTRYMMPGETIHHADVSLSWVPLTKASVAAISEKATLVGRVCAKGLSPYRAISPSFLRTDRIVSKGDQLTIQSEVGGLLVEKRIVAKQAGSKGDTIIVFDVDSKKSMKAQIVDKETVRLL